MATKTGNAKDNVIDGTASADTLWGRGGNDTLSGLGGNDKLYGEAGIDILKGGLGNDRLDGGGGIDRITYYNDGGTKAVYVDLQAGQASRGTEVDTLVSVEDVFGSLYNDVIYGSSVANKISGSLGNDTIFGRAGDDFFSGGGGDDYIDGGSGARDKVSYESVAASSGLYADLQSGTIYTYGVDGTDTVVAVEDLDGSNFDDDIYGNGIANTLTGLGGDDEIYGGGGNDRLYGVLGADYLDGQGGSDSLRGGADADTFAFYYHEGDGTGRDTVEDFVKGEDKLYFHIHPDGAYLANFSEFDTNSNGVMDDADDFTRIESVNYNGSTRISTVIDATDATTEAGELSIVIFGVTGITSSDFLYG